MVGIGGGRETSDSMSNGISNKRSIMTIYEKHIRKNVMSAERERQI